MKQHRNLCVREHITKTALYSKWASKQLDAFSAFAKTTFGDGALSHKEKELIAIGCAHVLQCPYCIDYHVELARKAAASNEEIAEAAWVGIFVASISTYEFSTMTAKILGGSDGEGNNLTNDISRKFDQLSNSCLEDGVLKRQFKLLIAISCAHNIFSTASAKNFARSAEESGQSKNAISEAIWVAVEMAGGACFGHSGLTAALLEELE